MMERVVSADVYKAPTLCQTLKAEGGQGEVQSKWGRSPPGARSGGDERRTCRRMREDRK